jgi:cytidylate kinase
MVAARLHMAHLDSGSLYRAMTWVALSSDLEDPLDIVAAAEASPITLERAGDELLVHAGGKPVAAAIRDARVTANVSAISALPEVRDWVNRLIRRAAAEPGGAVVDGRDIGTVVFPEAPLKVFLTATPAARAGRRLLQRGTTVDPEELARETALLEERDRRDSSRAVAPLRPADDAIVLDTTRLTLEEQVGEITALAAGRGLSVG